MEFDGILELRDDFGVQPALLPIQELCNYNRFAFSADRDGRVEGLSLSNLKLSTLPPIAAWFPHLKVLRAFGNMLETLPPDFSQLPLEAVYLGANDFRVFPEVLLDLESLSTLGINLNHLTDLPPELQRLTHLRKLGLANNDLTSVPTALKGLPALTGLYIGSNEFTAVPNWIGQLSSLRELSLSKASVSELPQSLSHIRLEGLSLRETSIEELDPIVTSITSLRRLDLNGVPITELPTSIANLKDLRTLDLTGTHISGLPQTFEELTSLRELYLSALRLSQIPPEVTRLSKLKTLYLSGTRVVWLTPDLGRLQDLRELDLSGMGLVTLPREILELPSLQRLNLSGNRLRALPANVAESQLDVRWNAGKSGDGIFVKDNPLELPPIEIVSAGGEAVRRFLRSAGEASLPINEVRLLLVGEGGAGKTSVGRRLMNRGFDALEAQTHGINIHRHEIAIGDSPVVGHIWDFGGQEIMHATHQFFLSKRSIYMVVVDARRDERIEYWLKHVTAFGGESPIIVVVNKIDENPAFQLNRRRLKDKYPNIRSFVRVSCLTNEGDRALKRNVAEAIARVDHVQTTWPTRWLNVKQDLEHVDRDFISLGQFRSLCETHGVHDHDDQEVLIQYLHDLGIVLHFKDLPLRDTNVINPQWVTRGVYAIINWKSLAAKGGLLDSRNLGEIFDPAEHPPEKHAFLLELMTKFELCYWVDDNRVLFPGLLPIEEPAIDPSIREGLRFQVQYKLLPKSILVRLMVKLQEDIKDDLRWRSGVVFENAAFASQALVRTDEEEGLVEVIVSGESPRDHLALIRGALLSINRSFGHLDYREVVPLPDRPEVSVSWEHLQLLEREGTAEFIPDGAKRRYRVDELIGRLRPSQQNEDEVLRLLRQLVDQRDDESSLSEKVNAALMLQPNVFGVGLNINALIKRVLANRQQPEASDMLMKDGSSSMDSE